MEIFFLILIVLGIVTSIFASFALSDESKNEPYIHLQTIISLVLSGFLGIIVVVYSAIAVRKPTPMDVYQGKTDLEITYTIVNNDTTSVDSTVVWKK